MAISGKEIQAKIGGMSPVAINGNYAWTAEEAVAELDGTTAEDDGFENPEAGLKSCVVNLKGYMDVQAGEYTPVVAGTTISNLKLYRDKDDATPAFVFTSALVLNSTQGGEVNGKVEWTARVKSKGSYTYNDPA